MSRSQTLILLFAFLMVNIMACAGSKPDLEIVLVKCPNVAEQTQYGMPIEMLIANKGTKASSRFKVSAEHIQSASRYTIQLNNQKGDNSWYIWHDAPIQATTKTERLTAYMDWNKQLSGPQEFVITVDSCIGDELMPNYCRVEESNEKNNDYLFTRCFALMS